MAWLAGVRRPSRLLALFLAAALLPAGALAWLGGQLIAQDRRLERQRVQDLVESTANGVTAAIEREVGAIERGLGSVAPRTSKREPQAGVTLRLTRRGQATNIDGPPLAYELIETGPLPEPPDSVWHEGERLEFVEHDASAAARAYRALAASSDANVRAGALIRLARSLKQAGRPDEALHAYAELAATGDATLLGDPADLMARWASVELLASLGRRDEVRASATSLDSDLRSGHWRLSRTTALVYAEALEPWRNGPEQTAFTERLHLTDAVGTIWNEWHSTPMSSGRRSVRTGGDDVLVVWREAGDDLLLFAASPADLVRVWQRSWATQNIAVALVNHDGQVVAGDTPAASLASIVKPDSETRLPWTVRVAAASTPAEISATGASRRRIITAVLIVLAILVPATGYLVIRAARREMALARQQAEFVSAVSHEFRSPLTSLAHLTSLLRSDFQPSEERRKQYYDVLAGETERLRRFVETLLDFGRMQAGATQYHLSTLDPRPLVSAVVEEFMRHAASRGHAVSFEAPGQVPCVAADADALGRALWNLLENAAKYSPVESPVVVRLEEDDGCVAIRVRDEGAGIPPAEQPFVFDQFYRGAAASESAVKGTGVGLAVVRHIVLGHGGDIRLESAPGIGSTFSILLPTPPVGSAREPARRVS